MKDKILVILIVIVLGGAGFLYYKSATTEIDAYSAIDIIADRLDGRKQLIDYDNEIDVDSIDDIGFKVKDKKIIIYYGKIEIPVESANLKDKDFINKLRNIGITIKKNNKGNYNIYYWGSKIRKWAD